MCCNLNYTPLCQKKGQVSKCLHLAAIFRMHLDWQLSCIGILTVALVYCCAHQSKKGLLLTVHPYDSK